MDDPTARSPPFARGRRSGLTLARPPPRLPGRDWGEHLTWVEEDLPGFYLLIALLSVPPVLSLWATVRRHRQARRHGRRGIWPLFGAAFSLAALAVNLRLVIAGAASAGGAGAKLGPGLAWASGLSWLCLWIWVVALILSRRHRHGTR